MAFNDRYEKRNTHAQFANGHACNSAIFLSIKLNFITTGKYRPLIVHVSLVATGKEKVEKNLSFQIREDLEFFSEAQKRDILEVSDGNISVE